VTLGHCIKPGIDNKGVPDTRACGIVAGDEESLRVFKPIFDAVIDAYHDGYSPEDRHTTNMNPYDLSETIVDPEGKYVLSSRFSIGRSLSGYRLSPCITFDERRKIEKSLVRRLLSLDGALKGDYFPLRGSRSYPNKAKCMK